MSLIPISVRLGSLGEHVPLQLTAAIMAFSYKIEPLSLDLASGLEAVKHGAVLLSHRAVTDEDVRRLDLTGPGEGPFLNGDTSTVLSLDTVLVLSSVLRRRLVDFSFTLEAINLPWRSSMSPIVQRRLDDFIMRLLKIAKVQFKTSPAPSNQKGFPHNA